MANSSSTKPKPFASFGEEELSKFLENNDTDNAKRSEMQAINILNEYWFEKTPTTLVLIWWQWTKTHSLPF